MLTYDETRLVADLKRLSRPLRVLFAAACAERQVPAYTRFLNGVGVEYPNAVGAALDDVWANPARDDSGELERQLEECMALIPREDAIDRWTEDVTYGANAAISVAYALRARKGGDAREAAFAGRIAYESLDHFVVNRQNVDLNLAGAEERVLAHPLIQAELLRQRRDVDELGEVKDPDLTSTAARLRHRAAAEGALFFGSPLSGE